jgi:hypothetical protein
MKSSLSHLQFENEQLRSELAKVKEESRSMEDRLVQEQLHNGDLAARLDDARNLLRDRGIDSETRLGSRTRRRSGVDSDDEISEPRTLPAGRATRKPRKPPTAQIPGDLDDLPSASDTETSQGGTISFRDRASLTPRPAFADDAGLRSLENDQLRWQPVAAATESPPPARR